MPAWDADSNFTVSLSKQKAHRKGELMWELAILASQRACMRVVIRGLAAVLLELPAHPASVPDADSIPVQSKLNKQKRHHKGVVFVCWDGGN